MRVKSLIFILLAFVLSCTCTDGKVRQYKVEVVKEYPHDTSAYTQGLFFHNGELYESTGQYGKSSLRKVDLATGKVLNRVNFSKKYFVEGSVILGDNLYLLTWTDKVAFIYGPDSLDYRATYSYPREGWGLTTDGKNLIASDGSSNLIFMKDDFTLLNKVAVKMSGRPQRLLNELEYIDGKVWANVYTTDLILIINPTTGEVEATIDASNLLPDKDKTPTAEVLNGIAYNPDNGKIYLTGKYWPRLYEVRLVELK
ncbi:MAG: glutaminyl-peptide cyclotransferase [Bacteroidales bacterium]|nr:glutaminyl-peptide cyclotransferase [Bacteroidales bacterium]